MRSLTRSTAQPRRAKADVVTGQAETPFAGSPIGTIEDGGREVTMRENNLAGLNVTRKVFVPRDGYFARYLETLANPGTEPITVDVRRSQVRGGSVLFCQFFCSFTPHSAAVIRRRAAIRHSASPTRDGGSLVVLDEPSTPIRSSPTCRRWRVRRPERVDSGRGDHIHHRRSVMELQWRQVTVPPGGTVSLMHFIAQQTSRAAAYRVHRRVNCRRSARRTKPRRSCNDRQFCCAWYELSAPSSAGVTARHDHRPPWRSRDARAYVNIWQLIRCSAGSGCRQRERPSS
jgi:hypothetical protein